MALVAQGLHLEVREVVEARRVRVVVRLSIDFDRQLGRGDVEVGFEERVLNQILLTVFLLELGKHLSDCQVLLGYLVTLLGVLFFALLSSRLLLACISFKPLLVLAKIDPADHHLKLLELALSPLICDLLERAGEVCDAAFPYGQKFALGQVCPQVISHLPDNIIVKGVVQDVGVQNVDQKLQVLVAEEQVRILLLEGARKLAKQRISEWSFSVLKLPGRRTLRCVIFGISKAFGISHELISKRHHKNRVLIGAAEKFHVIFKQGLNNELACKEV